MIIIIIIGMRIIFIFKNIVGIGNNFFFFSINYVFENVGFYILIILISMGGGVGAWGFFIFVDMFIVFI